MDDLHQKEMLEQIKKLEDDHPRTLYGFRLGFQAAVAMMEKLQEQNDEGEEEFICWKCGDVDPSTSCGHHQCGLFTPDPNNNYD